MNILKLIPFIIFSGLLYICAGTLHRRTEQNRARRLGRPQANRNARQEEGPAESATSLFHPCGRAGAFRRDMEEPAPGSQSALHTPARRNSPILDARSVVRSHEADSRSAGYAHRSPGRGPRKPVEAFSPARKGVAAGRGRGCVCKGFSPRRAKPEGKASDDA
jgi:hypothetical protein